MNNVPEASDDEMDVDMPLPLPEVDPQEDPELEAPDPDACPPRRRATIEEVEDEDAPGHIFAKSFPSIKQAGATFGDAPTTFEAIRDDQILRGSEVLGPFESEDEWELAKWLIKNVGHNQADLFLKLPIIQQRVDPTFTTKDKFLGAIDSLPGGVGWNLHNIHLKGDIVNEDGDFLTEDLELWWRDPVECIRELMGNPIFRDVMRFTPEQLFEDSGGKEKIVDEMWTAGWWWKIQELLPEGATIAPIILSSDKTRLSQFWGDKSAWPVYLTIGNISKDVRREASSHATVLVGYLPVGKFGCFSDKAKQFERYRTFHHCMGIMTNSLVEAGKSGVDMACADGKARWVWPILAAYVADYPEQCLVACCMENRCPICKVHPERRGSHEDSPLRSERETLELLGKQHTNQCTAEEKTKFTEQGIRPIFPPFWARLPFTSIFQAFTPDLLHQLHKGVFKDHLVKWCTNLMGEKEIDARFKSMTAHPGLRHFKNGISSVSQWTGTEHKAMERVFIGIVAGAIPDARVTQAIRSITDFIFLLSLQSHTSSTLAALSEAFDGFHTYKDVFLELEARNPAHFNIPKIHAMKHYVSLIQVFGSADGFNTESPERLHIDYAKNAYRASSKKDYTIQMTHWLRRQEAVDRFTHYLDWIKNGEFQPDKDFRQRVQLQATELYANRDHTTLVPSISAPPPVPTYQIAKHHAPEVRGVLATTITINHHATQFLAAVGDFLRLRGSPITPLPCDGFNLFKRLTLTLPIIPQASPKDLANIVHATPPVAPRARTHGEPAHLDFALIRTGERNDKTKGTALEGLRIAHVRVLFALPSVYRVQTPHPLAYVEWFTPFNTVDPITGLYTVKPSTRNRHVYGEIISIDRIVRNCHLLPKFGRRKDTSWTTENVVNRCKVFYVSPYSDAHMFSLLKLRRRIHPC
ncbi:hypothetical protein Hypma_008517 [Hypsizygus marmoreus]|uniref:Uncharacterized protein n=1 Tax=Hypsizygus marmoreus TaxID=39966 RepID=A0A369JT09_HYPMA|nr:hypothetical protein Hypma_008517 [Hypsizygus marmoreus]